MGKGPKTSSAAAVAIVLTALACAGRVSAQSIQGPQQMPPGFVPLSRGTDVGGLARRTDVRLSGVTLGQAVTELAERGGLSLTYRVDLSGLDTRVDLSLTDATVADALLRVLRGSGLTLLVSPSGMAVLVAGSAWDIAGIVRDAAGGRPVPGALVRVLDGGPTTTTGPGGRFVLPDLGRQTVSLEVSAFGYDTARVNDRYVPDGGLSVIIELQPRVLPLPSIIVTPGNFGVLRPTGGATAFTREQADAAPQLGADVLRVVERVPGVSTDDVTTRLNVRGAWPEELRMTLDGMPLYEPYHLRDVDSPIGVIDLNAMKSVELVTGGATVEHGDALAGLLSLRTPEETGPARTKLGLSVSSLDGLVERDFADGKGRWLLSARRGYIDVLLSLAGADDQLYPRYYDVLGKVQYRLGTKHLLSIHALRAGDSFRIYDEEDQARASTTWDSSYGWLQWRFDPVSGLEASTIVSAVDHGRDRNLSMLEDPDVDTSPEILGKDVRDFREFGVRQDWIWEAARAHVLKWGIEARTQGAEYDYARNGAAKIDDPQAGVGPADSVAVDLDRNAAMLGAYAAWRVRPVEALTLEAGLRVDHQGHTDETELAPRANLAFELGQHATLRGSWGRYVRPQRLDELQVEDGVDMFRPAEEADQLVLGLDLDVRDNVSARVEAYDRRVAQPRPIFLNLFNAIDVFPEASGDRVRLDPESARASGVELSAAGADPAGRWNWRASYALARSTDRVDGVDVPRRHEQRHTFQVDWTWAPSPAWTLSAGWRLHSGWPITERTFAVVSTPDGGQRVSGTFGPIEGGRLPLYHRMDVRASRRMSVRGGLMEIFIDVFNIYGHDNARGLLYSVDLDGDTLRVKRELDTLLPRLPTAGLRWTF